MIDDSRLLWIFYLPAVTELHNEPSVVLCNIRHSAREASLKRKLAKLLI